MSDLTGPTNAVELVRTWVLKGEYYQSRNWHVVRGRDAQQLRWALCGAGWFGASEDTIRASRSDIRLGFIRPMCEECKRVLEDSDV